MTDSVLSQVVGAGLAARLSAKLGEGVLNGVLTARVGLAAVEVCRPMPFLGTAPPSLSAIAGGLLRKGE
jgi:putative membrane protein